MREEKEERRTSCEGEHLGSKQSLPDALRPTSHRRRDIVLRDISLPIIIYSIFPALEASSLLSGSTSAATSQQQSLDGDDSDCDCCDAITAVAYQTVDLVESWSQLRLPASQAILLSGNREEKARLA